MNPIIKNTLAFILGMVIGGAVNMLLVMIGPNLIPPPPGAELTTAEGLKASMHLLQPQHFIFPFLAHALGTFAGAWLAASIAASYKMRFAMAIGLFFLIGGIAGVCILPAPAWFEISDLLLAYLPMAYLGGKWAISKT